MLITLKSYSSVFAHSLLQSSMFLDPKTRSKVYTFLVYTFLVTASLVSAVYYIGSASISQEYKVRLARWRLIHETSKPSSTCENQCRPIGSEPLPKGIVSETTDLEMRPLWDHSMRRSAKTNPMYRNGSKHSRSLLALAVGIKQKKIVDDIVKKFMSGDFVVMLFHYDGIVNEWNDLVWSNAVIHVSALNQTKWWFGKRFLHPDVVAEYNYIFLWDEDLGVENFNPGRYLSIVKEEGLEISQPALDLGKSEVHHYITVRQRGSKVHRNYLNTRGSGCHDNSMDPPCVGWVEMMAPVFSRAAWRCTWYMIQNDLIHAWGLDFQLGYCAQGDRTRNVGVVDSEYIVHLSLPTLGALPAFHYKEPPKSQKPNNRDEVRMQSGMEMEIFKARWKNASEEDSCWVDPYRKQANT